MSRKQGGEQRQLHLGNLPCRELPLEEREVLATTTARSRSYPSEIVKVAARKLDLIHAAHTVADLRVPPGNRLEALRAT